MDKILNNFTKRNQDKKSIKKSKREKVRFISRIIEFKDDF